MSTGSFRNHPHPPSPITMLLPSQRFNFERQKLGRWEEKLGRCELVAHISGVVLSVAKYSCGQENILSTYKASSSYFLQETLHILYCAYRRPTVVPVLSQMKPLTAIPSSFLKICFNIMFTSVF